MTIRIGYIAPILLIALPLAACTKEEQRSTDAVLSVFGVAGVTPPDYGSGSPQVAALIEADVAPEPPAKVWTCWEEWHRAGTQLVEICDWQ